MRLFAAEAAFLPLSPPLLPAATRILSTNFLASCRSATAEVTRRPQGAVTRVLKKCVATIGHNVAQ